MTPEEGKKGLIAFALVFFMCSLTWAIVSTKNSLDDTWKEAFKETMKITGTLKEESIRGRKYYQALTLVHSQGAEHILVCRVASSEARCKPTELSATLAPTELVTVTVSKKYDKWVQSITTADGRVILNQSVHAFAPPPRHNMWIAIAATTFWLGVLVLINRKL